ncbi:hypothetical protein [Herbidospora sp. RD11066]
MSEDIQVGRIAILWVAASLCAVLAAILGILVIGLEAADELASVLGLAVALSGLALTMRNVIKIRSREGEPIVNELTGAEAAALVDAMAGDNWWTARAALLSVWAEVLPERQSAVESALDDTRRELAAPPPSGGPGLREELVTEWQARLRRYSHTEPAFPAALQDVIARKILPLLPQPPAARADVQMNAIAFDQARINQSGGDMHINERGT